MLFLFSSLFLLPFVLKNIQARFVLLAIFFFGMGIFRVSFFIPRSTPDTLSFYNGQHQKITAVIREEPDVRTDKINYIAEAREISPTQKVQGRVLFQSSLYPRYHYGDRVSLDCLLKTPEPIEDFRYDRYLANMNVFSVCVTPKISLQASGQGNVAYNFLLQKKNFLAQKINTLWHEPYASFVGGILYGYRGGLGKLQNDFNRTGVTHIVAVSGFNITVIASIFSTLLISLFIPRKKAFFVVVIAIICFVIFVGASASVVRAGVMGIITLLAKQLGRRSRAFGTIVLATVLMVIHNPLVLLFDAGFQLSVLSTLGLVYFSESIQKRLSFVPTFLGIQESLSSTLSAILVTLPLILFQFGRLSLVAPVVNVLILPCIPIAMLLSFSSIILSFLYLPFGRIVSYLTFFVLFYVVKVVEWFSALPFASVDMKISLLPMIILYLTIFGVYFWNHKKKNTTTL